MSPGQRESLNPSRFGRPLVVDIVRDDGPAPPVAASRPPAVGKGWPVYTASLTARLADFGQHPTAPIRLKMVNRPPTVYWKKWSGSYGTDASSEVVSVIRNIFYPEVTGEQI